MSMDDDMRSAVDERLAARLETNRARRDARRRRLAELSERRRHGLTARHATKLARITRRGPNKPWRHLDCPTWPTTNGR